MDKEQVGKFIATERKKKGLTQKELADLLFVTDKAVSKWERGLSYPDISQLEPLADVLCVSVLEIMRGEHIAQENTLSFEDASQMIDDSISLSDEKINRMHTQSKLLFLLCLVFIMFLISFTLNIINFTRGNQTIRNQTTYSQSTESIQHNSENAYNLRKEDAE